MAVESNPTFPKDLDPNWPAGSETRREGDDHLRNIKQVVTEYLGTETGCTANDTYPLVSALHPPGIIIWAINPSANPEGAVGGTWTLVGTLDVNGTTLDCWRCTVRPTP